MVVAVPSAAYAVTDRCGAAVYAAGRWGAWVNCRCGWVSNNWRTVGQASIRWALHVRDMATLERLVGMSARASGAAYAVTADAPRPARSAPPTARGSQR